MDRSKWEYKKLSDVSDIIMGQSPSSDSYNEDGKGLPFYQGNADFGELYPTARVYCDAPSREADTDDILMSVRAPIGAINIANEHCCIGRGLCAIRPIPKVSDKMFLFYFLRAKNVFLNSQGTGSTFKSISKKVVYDLDIPMPSFADQQRIVAELDCLNEMIVVKQEQLKEFDKLAQSIFYDMFGDPASNEKGWGKLKMKDICEIIAGGDKPDNLSDIKTDDYCYPVIANGEGDKGILGYSRTRRVVKDSVTIGARGASIGNCRIVYGGFTPVVRLISLTPNDQVNCIYLYYFAKQMPYFSTGAGQAQLTVPNVKMVTIPLPPLSLQQQFAEKIQAIEAQKELVKQSIAETQHLLDYTMDKYFNE